MLKICKPLRRKASEAKISELKPPDSEVLHGVPERIGLGVSRPTVCFCYANRRKPSFKMFFAAFTSRSWIVPHLGQAHSRTDRSFVPGH